MTDYSLVGFIVSHWIWSEMINFAFERVINGIGWNRYHHEDSSSQGKYFIKNIYHPTMALSYWFEKNGIETKTITIDDALKSNDNFVYSLRIPICPYDVKDRFEGFSLELVESINDGQCNFVISDAVEGCLWEQKDIDHFVNKLQEAMIRPEKVIVLSSCQTHIYDYKFPFKMVHWHWNESVASDQIEKIKLKPKNKNAKKFLSLNKANKEHRIEFVRQMWNKGVLDQFNVSLGKVEGEDEFARSTPYVYDKFSGEDIGGKGHTKAGTWLDPWHQEENLLYIVTESEYVDLEKRDVSEKTYKPIALKMPFILIDQPYSLRRLRDLGYKTFYSLWDESYDDIEDPKKRMETVVDLVAYLNSRKDFLDIIESCEDIVNHNFNLLRMRSPEQDMIRVVSHYENTKC